MAVKKTLKKKIVDFGDIRKKFSSVEKYKDQRYFDLGKTFQEACGIPGPAMGQTNMLLGHSDTGKTTALIKTAIDAQKKGVLPVFIITEQKFSFEHAKTMGFECDKVVSEEGEYWDGFLLYKLGFDFIEQAFEYVTSIMDAQKKGEIPYDIVFLWDSVGTIPCEMSFNGKGGNMHTARVISEKWGMGMAQRIAASRKESEPYTNTMVIVNQPWVQIPEGFGQQPKIMPKGGESFYLSSALVFLFGNQANAGTSKISATAKGRKINFATRTKVGILKNHMTGLGYSDGKIIAAIHDFVEDDKDAIQKYKDQHVDYFQSIFDGLSDLSELELEETAVIETDVDTSDKL